MPVTIVHASPKIERIDAIGNLLRGLDEQVSYAPNLEEARGRLRVVPAGSKQVVVIPDELADSSLADAAVNFAETEAAKSFVIFIADTMSAEAYKRLVRTGSGEWIKWETFPREITDLIAASHNDRNPSVSEAATIVSFLPSKGGVGNTTLALEVAVCLTAKNKMLRGRVAVVDLNFQGSTLGDALDIDSRFDVSEVLNRPERVDARLIDVFASKHSSTVDIFACPPRYGNSEEIRPDVIFALLDTVACKYDVVLLDLPNHWQSWIDNAVQGSTAVVITGESTVPSLRQIASRLAYVDALNISADRNAVVINRCEGGLFGRISRRNEIERALPGRRTFFVRHNAGLAADAANTGRPMAEVGPNQAVTKNIRRIAEWLSTMRGAAHSLEARA